MGDLRDERELPNHLDIYTRGTDLGAWWDPKLAGVGGRHVTCCRPNGGDGGCMQPMREGGYGAHVRRWGQASSGGRKG